MTDSGLPLGRHAEFPREYSPDVLFAIARSDGRESLGQRGELPFHGVDIWNVWELTWLGSGDLPVAATAEIRVPANTPKLLESKSLKLYLNSYAMTRFDGLRTVAATLGSDLSACTGGSVEVSVNLLTADHSGAIAELPGTCIDALPVQCRHWQVDAALLWSDESTVVEETLTTHLLRSLCPVTSQPDVGSLLVHYSGPKIDHAALLEYIVSFREHNDFHEACIERMFLDIAERCRPLKLSVYGRYLRRGGIDINPFRSNFEESPANQRLWRQ